ncbi:MAG: hypothetical protein ACREBD_21575, partial [Blastocatellia bacterium]
NYFHPAAQTFGLHQPVWKESHMIKSDFRRLRSIRFYGASALLIFSALILAFSNFASTTEAQQSSARQATAKRPLTHQDYDSWRSIQGQSISRDGKFVAYAAIPQDGDGEIVARNVATGAECSTTCWCFGLPSSGACLHIRKARPAVIITRTVSQSG